MTNEHLKHQHSQSVPINTLIVSSRLYNLWCEIIGRTYSESKSFSFRLSCIRQTKGATEEWRLTAERPGDVRDVFGESKVGNLNVSIRTEQDVFWLEIAVDDVEGMEVVESECDLGGEELGDWIRESLFDSLLSITKYRNSKVNGRRRESAYLTLS